MRRTELAALLLALFLVSCAAGDRATTPSVSLTATPTSGGSGTPASPDARPSSDSSAGKGDVVILVHGWFGMPREFLPMKAFLDDQGFRTFIAILPGEDNIVNANYLRDFVREVEELTGVQEVDTVGFSMGGLSLRYYIRFLDGEQDVRRYVSIDTPQYGDPAACLLPPEAGGQMCPGSPFLTELNQDDDTPGAVSYTTILNAEGDIPASRLYDGAAEVTVSAPHGELLQSADVFEAVRVALSH